MARKNTNKKAVATEEEVKEVQETRVEATESPVVGGEAIDDAEQSNEEADERVSIEELSSDSAENNQEQEEGIASDEDDTSVSQKPSFNSHTFGYSWNGMEMDW